MNFSRKPKCSIYRLSLNCNPIDLLTAESKYKMDKNLSTTDYIYAVHVLTTNRFTYSQNLPRGQGIIDIFIGIFQIEDQCQMSKRTINATNFI